MTEELKQQYQSVMKAKAMAYAEDVLSEVKNFMPKDEYEDAIKDFAQAYISGANAAIETAKEIITNNGELTNETNSI